MRKVQKYLSHSLVAQQVYFLKSFVLNFISIYKYNNLSLVGNLWQRQGERSQQQQALLPALRKPPLWVKQRRGVRGRAKSSRRPRSSPRVRERALRKPLDWGEKQRQKKGETPSVAFSARNDSLLPPAGCKVNGG